jgi:hypothetical protein
VSPGSPGRNERHGDGCPGLFLIAAAREYRCCQSDYQMAFHGSAQTEKPEDGNDDDDCPDNVDDAVHGISFQLDKRIDSRA